MRFTSDIIRSSFQRLQWKLSGGKAGKERTSALMYFLAYDTSFKSHEPISLNPNTWEGKTNRKIIANEYHKLVTVHTYGTKQKWAVYDLGFVDKNGIDPLKRISSNFFTVPLKKASQRTEAIDYPARPCSILKLGTMRAVGNWGICPHKDWEKNIPILLAERKTRSPFTDLAIFTLRDMDFVDNSSLLNTLKALLIKKYSKPLSSYWNDKISIEFKYNYFKSREVWCNEDYHYSFQDESWVNSISEKNEKDLNYMNVSQLKNRITYLEYLLRKHKIPFDDTGGFIETT